MPLKRQEALVQLSREHHFALLLCWKIKEGIKKNVASARIFSYVDWFYKNHLKPHFEVEEQTLFPVLGSSHSLIIEALNQHSQLIHWFEKSERNSDTLISISQKLDEHVRFEERQVFEEIQKNATQQLLAEILQNNPHHEFVENNEDKFWE